MKPPRLDAPVTRRDVIAGGLRAAALLAVGCGSSTPPAAGDHAGARPDLVLVMTDDQSFDEIGYASGGRVRTPHLDRLAAGGAVFRSAYCSAIPCISSRASLMSGVDFHRWSLTGKAEDTIVEGTWTWAHALRAAGYETVLVGKMHLTPRDGNHGFERMALCDPKPKPPGALPRDDYEHWLERRGALAKVRHEEKRTGFPHTRTWSLDPTEHRVSWVRDRAIEFLRARAQPRKRPYALVVSFLAPHLPYDPAEPFASMYSPASIEIPTDHWDDLQGMPPSLAHFASLGFRRDRMSREAFQRLVSAYRALTSQLDDAVGAIAQHLDLDRTLLLFGSDHGDYLGKRDRVLKSPPVPFEPLARIPMFACGTGVAAGIEVASPVSLADVAPTFLTAAGLPVPADLDGTALQPLLAAPERAPARGVYCVGPGYFHMLRRADVKYLRSEDGREELLFDLATDPAEHRDLSRDPAWEAARADLAGELDRRLARPRPQLPPFLATRPRHHFGTGEVTRL